MSIAAAPADGGSRQVAVPSSAPTPTSVEAQLPEMTGYVFDEAALLGDEAAKRLTIRLIAFEQLTRHQFVVVTVRSLRGLSIEEFGLRLGNQWGVGRKNINDGVLLIVAPIERKVRIEVGFGLVQQLSNSDCDAIINSSIIPAFRKGDFASGIDAGASAIIARIS